ncbi:hypothetical protein [Xanthomonas translucens]|uniref:Secreted protein n=3 Tax=Xanthomonas campestris pv. translucens TaxID=343 RepID=A0A109HJ86_XANCT|nr:hypothetical protein [Xanthomonas translucens]KTF40965.1 hypothetical protein OZ12_04105 [Xanthomonas translucens pv. translucens]KWV13253.1 hypothetical protein ATB53_04515 [Xanthomonas translucens]KWV17059.1 hypothetical protein ATB54_00010 [Xanthomonas translucens]MCC8448623.1 hypothetical protein [Xanthomonas translucens pv. translucens]MCS3360150.1 hypothetical protein [Xanthomonas translucens pv. translucens]
MKKLHILVFAGCLLGLSPLASAEVVNLTNSADGANRGAGIAAVKKKLQYACTSRKGTPDLDSFEVVFEKTSQNPDVPKPYYVDGKLKCNLP